jgi:hypothetical protein
MFWGFGMPSFNVHPQPPPQPQLQHQNPLGGLIGGFTDFLNNSFMHPLFGPSQEEQAAQRTSSLNAEQQSQQEARPTFTRANKRESQKEKEGPKKK